MSTFHLEPIGIIRSPYQEKFAVPRQPNLVSASDGELQLLSPYNDPNSVKGLEQFSHLWLVFLFHHLDPSKWNATVRPPRLGGNKSLGVFATRSPFRPNHIGLSAVELRDIVVENKQVILKLGSLDLVDGTPIIDIKPYLPYCDSYPNANAGYAQSAPNSLLDVEFTEEAEEKITTFEKKQPQLRLLITQVLSQDPRPAYKKEQIDTRLYGINLYQFNIKWQVVDNQILVIDIE